MFENLRARIFSGVILFGFVAGLLTFGVVGMKVLTLILTALMSYDWLRIIGYMRKRYFFVMMLVITLPLLVVFFREPLLALGVLFLLASAIILLREVFGKSLLKVAFGALLIGLLGLSIFSCLALCQNGFFMVTWIALIVAAMDIGGYFWGTWIGGPKLAKRISPNKTLSGFLGGLISAVFVSVLTYNYYFSTTLPASLLWRIILLGALAACGDLLESWVKRLHHVKNSGNMLPGHGGVLDRFDGYLLSMPGLYVLIYFDRYFMISFGEFEKVF